MHRDCKDCKFKRFFFCNDKVFEADHKFIVPPPSPSLFGHLLGLHGLKFIGSDKLKARQTHKTDEAGTEKHHVTNVLTVYGQSLFLHYLGRESLPCDSVGRKTISNFVRVLSRKD
jgi:hypothetical protein